MVTYIQVPLRLSNQTPPSDSSEFYLETLKKAKCSFTINIFGSYIEGLILHFGSFFEQRSLCLIKLAALYFNYVPSFLVSEYEYVTIAGAHGRLTELISQYGENHQLVAKQRKLIQVLERIDGLARNIGLTLNFYFSKDEQKVCSLIQRNCILFNYKFLEMDQDEMEAVLAREVQHINYNHAFKKKALHVALFAIDVFLFFTIPIAELVPLAIVTFEIIAFFVESFVSKYFEKQADLCAMDLVGTNQGLSKFFERIIQIGGQDYFPRFVPIPVYACEGLTSENIFEIHKMRMPVEPSRPWMPYRLNYCRNYTPVAST